MVLLCAHVCNLLKGFVWVDVLLMKAVL